LAQDEAQDHRCQRNCRADLNESPVPQPGFTGSAARRSVRHQRSLRCDVRRAPGR
jgi:hypothetical protein